MARVKRADGGAVNGNGGEGRKERSRSARVDFVLIRQSSWRLSGRELNAYIVKRTVKKKTPPREVKTALKTARVSLRAKPSVIIYIYIYIINVYIYSFVYGLTDLPAGWLRVRRRRRRR